MPKGLAAAAQHRSPTRAHLPQNSFFDKAQRIRLFVYLVECWLSENMDIPRKHGGIKKGLHFTLFLSIPEADAYSDDSRSHKTFHQINHLHFS